MREPVDHPDYKYDTVPRGTLLSNESDYQLEDEAIMECRLNEDQVHDIYVRRIMAKVNAFQYVEYNGSPVIGPDRIRFAFEFELRNLLLSYEHEGEDYIKAKSKDNNTYYFSRGT